MANLTQQSLVVDLHVIKPPYSSNDCFLRVNTISDVMLLHVRILIE